MNELKNHTMQTYAHSSPCNPYFTCW